MNNIEFEEIRVMLPELRIWFGDREIYLSMTEMRLLLILLSDPRAVFPVHELTRRMDLMSREALIVTVSHLRQKLGKKYIVTTPRVGYALAQRSKN
jgi:DNA-binding response OmpR family regulator